MYKPVFVSDEREKQCFSFKTKLPTIGNEYEGKKADDFHSNELYPLKLNIISRICEKLPLCAKLAPFLLSSGIINGTRTNMNTQHTYINTFIRTYVSRQFCTKMRKNNDARLFRLVFVILPNGIRRFQHVSKIQNEFQSFNCVRTINNTNSRFVNIFKIINYLISFKLLIFFFFL